MGDGYEYEPRGSATPVTLEMLRALLLSAQHYPGAAEAVMPHLINEVIDGRLRLNELTGRLEETR